MTMLPKEKRYHGFTYKQISCGGRAYFYAQTKEGRIIAYEVFKRRYAPPRTREIAGETMVFGGGDQWPHNEAFGSWAWAFMTEAKARAKFNQLEAEV